MQKKIDKKKNTHTHDYILDAWKTTHIFIIVQKNRPSTTTDEWSRLQQTTATTTKNNRLKKPIASKKAYEDCVWPNLFKNAQ